MLSAQHLVKSFAGRRVIEDVTLQLGRGEVVGLLGPNGAGKTTTFQMLTGMIVPDAGAITLDGHNVTAMPSTTGRVSASPICHRRPSCRAA